ncbi:uncharacterized protein EV422DRAFT_496516 [Fimicolochytrium jonesii]|uniref:uncharacterized protein n=1 Tax=Fimicolochytrium jonesii TaxID=1396493 RepID=UPI0022FE6478|nr:uncharacterized protein EV422DRAFT_496516 [Fimicolochytrium jonesii]KAI8820820.1 hypothetical protein EV422DRAFT_496516 [Fimicolochytrium jonesii]
MLEGIARIPPSPPCKRRNVGYMFSNEAREAADKLPVNQMRSTFVHSLVMAYGLPKAMKIIRPHQATREELCTAHSEELVGELLASSDLDIGCLTLISDCPVFPGLSSYVQLVAGGTLAAARAIVEGQVDIAIHWDGGRCVSVITRASGFCYVNDIVLSILELQKKYRRILYLDIDIHHGDGVEAAFLFSPRVFTCSFHKYDQGFYPGTGSPMVRGSGKGLHHTLNVPLKSGLRGPLFLQVFQRIVDGIMDAYTPDCIVLQCGADGAHLNLNAAEEAGHGQRNDRGMGWNLDPGTFGDAVAYLRDLPSRDGTSSSPQPAIPLLILGGGGYVNTITARCWAKATAAAIGDVNLVNDVIPEHALWPEYGRDPELGCRLDENEVDGSIGGVLEGALASLERLREAKSGLRR